MGVIADCGFFSAINGALSTLISISEKRKNREESGLGSWEETGKK